MGGLAAVAPLISAGTALFSAFMAPEAPSAPAPPAAAAPVPAPPTPVSEPVIDPATQLQSAALALNNQKRAAAAQTSGVSLLNQTTQNTTNSSRNLTGS